MSAGAGGPVLTTLQEDLLRAAFGVDETAVAAWRRWRDAIDWEAHLDRDAFRLMPRTCRTLRRLGEADPLLPRLQGIARQAWYANQRWVGRLQPTLQALAASGVELLLVPPTAVLLLDRTPVLDPAAPLACAVRGEQAEAAIRCLWRLGWRTSVRVPHWSLAGYVMAGRRLTWWNPDGQALDLVWQWDRSDRSGRFPREVWERTGQGRLANVPVLTPDAADAVHDLCRQAPAGSCFAQMVDLLLLVDAMPGPLDWSRLFARAAHAPLDPGWRECFVRLHAVLPHSLPSCVVLDWPAVEMPPAGPAGGRCARGWPLTGRPIVGPLDALRWPGRSGSFRVTCWHAGI